MTDQTIPLLQWALEGEDHSIERIRLLAEEARDYQDRSKNEPAFMALDEICELVTQAQEALQSAMKICKTHSTRAPE